MSNSGKASREALETLHGAIATSLTDKIRDGSATAADLSAAIRFLKDNGIDAIAANGNGLEKLKDSLPFQTVEEISEEESE